MKNGKRLTKNESIFVQEKGLDPKEWLVVKNTPKFIQLLSRKDNKTTKTIFKD